jgi:hypothetical protein
MIKYPTHDAYFFPEPGLFLGVKSEESQDIYFRNWISYRDIFVYRMMAEVFLAYPLTPSQWRLFLGPTFNKSKPSSSSTRSAKQRSDVRDLVGETLRVFEDEVGASHEVEARWRGKVYPDKIPHEVRKEVLYDLYEMNFYCDLTLLDQKANPWVKQRPLRHVRIDKCFLTKFYMRYPADLAYANQGFSAPTIEKRLPYLLYLGDLMRDWQGRRLPCEIERMKQAQEYTTPEMLALENAVAMHFTLSFFDYFGRAAVVPHHL